MSVRFYYRTPTPVMIAFFIAGAHNITEAPKSKVHLASLKSPVVNLFPCPCLYIPVAALLAELLLEVAQGETVALHGPPVGDLLAAEEIRHHRLAPAAAAHHVASCAFFTLLHPEIRQREGRVRRSGRPFCDASRADDQKRNQTEGAANLLLSVQKTRNTVTAPPPTEE